MSESAHTTTTTPTRDSILTYREINQENWRAVVNLDLKDGQVGNLASNLYSVCESRFDNDAWIRAIYADDTLVGMIMLSMSEPYIWRFMVDARYQGLGYGKRGVQFAIDHIRQRDPGTKQIKLNSTPPEGYQSDDPRKNVTPEDSPFRFYEKLGFRKIADPDEENELIMAMDL